MMMDMYIEVTKLLIGLKFRAKDRTVRGYQKGLTKAPRFLQHRPAS